MFSQVSGSVEVVVTTMSINVLEGDLTACIRTKEMKIGLSAYFVGLFSVHG